MVIDFIIYFKYIIWYIIKSMPWLTIRTLDTGNHHNLAVVGKAKEDMIN